MSLEISTPTYVRYPSTGNEEEAVLESAKRPGQGLPSAADSNDQILEALQAVVSFEVWQKSIAKGESKSRT
jgi:hypothetical protein